MIKRKEGVEKGYCEGVVRGHGRAASDPVRSTRRVVKSDGGLCTPKGSRRHGEKTIKGQRT